MDIPLLSRIIGVTEAYIEHGYEHLVSKSSIWYEQSLVDKLKKVS